MHISTGTPLLLLLASLSQISAKYIVHPRAAPENIEHALDLGIGEQFSAAFNMIKDNESQQFCQQLVDKLPKGGEGSEKAPADDTSSSESDDESDDEDYDENRDQGGDRGMERIHEVKDGSEIIEPPSAEEEENPGAAPEDSPAPAPDSTPEAAPDSAPDSTPEPSPDSTPEPSPDSTPEPSPDSTPEPAPDSTPEPAPDSAPDSTPEAAPDSASPSAPEETPDEGVPPGIPGAGPDAKKDVEYHGNMNINPTTGKPKSMETSYHAPSDDNVNVNENMNASGDIPPPMEAGMKKRQDQQGVYDLYGLTVPKGLVGFDPKTLEGACKKYVLEHV